MKLAIDCRMIGSGGIGTYLCGLLPFFIERYQCVLLGRSSDLEEFKGKNGVEILDCSIKTFSLKELLNFPASLLKAINGCDAYYSPYCNIPGRLFGGISVPVFSTIHDIVFLDIPELAGGLGTAARKWFYQQAIGHSDCVFTVSQFSAGRIQALLRGIETGSEIGSKGTTGSITGSRGATASGVPLVVTYNAVPHWFTAPESGSSSDTGSSAAQKSLTGSSSLESAPSQDLLFVGNIKAHKGLHILLPAFKLARQRGLQGRLVIVGNANNFRTGDRGILEQFKALPEEDFSFTGRVSDSELRDLYRRCRLLVQPSLYEGFGMPPLEALSQGTNVVLSDIPVFQEIYEGMPVTFFKAGDVEDLAEKLLSAWQLPPPVLKENPYSFKRSASIIFDTIEKIVTK